MITRSKLDYIIAIASLAASLVLCVFILYLFSIPDDVGWIYFGLLPLLIASIISIIPLWLTFIFTMVFGLYHHFRNPNIVVTRKEVLFKAGIVLFFFSLFFVFIHVSDIILFFLTLSSSPPLKVPNSL